MAASCPQTFFLDSNDFQVLPLVIRRLLPHILNLSTKFVYKVLTCMGSKKQQRRGWDYSNFTKGETSLVSLKLSAIWNNLTLHHSCLSLPKNTSFFQFGQLENICWHSLEKIFLVCFSPLSPHAGQKEVDEHFANHLQMYVGRPLLRPKNL